MLGCGAVTILSEQTEQATLSLQTLLVSWLPHSSVFSETQILQFFPLVSEVRICPFPIPPGPCHLVGEDFLFPQWQFVVLTSILT